MKLRSITLKNFRSYPGESFIFHDHLNVIYGDNAQGKTNLLESIHFLLAFKPFKQVKTEEIIKFGALESRIKGEIESEAGLDEIHILISSGKKNIKLNGKVIYSTSKIMGRYNVVSFLPSDIDLIKGSPGNRRRYLDALICTMEPAHIRDLKQYHRALTQRNSILASSYKLTRDQVEIWDEQLAETGSQILSRRSKFIKKIKPHFNRLYALTSGTSEEIGIHYKCSFPTEGKLIQDFISELKSNFEIDKQRKHTTVGPHRDQITFTIGSRDAAVYASQGEAKNLALSLKASEIDLTREMIGRTPILLLDDVTSELDERRKRFLFKMISNFSGQTFITSTSLKDIHHKGEMKLFRINNGRVQQKFIQQR